MGRNLTDGDIQIELIGPIEGYMHDAAALAHKAASMACRLDETELDPDRMALFALAMLERMDDYTCSMGNYDRGSVLRRLEDIMLRRMAQGDKGYERWLGL